MAVAYPHFGWIEHDGKRALVVVIKKTPTGKGRGRRWLGTRWSAIASFANVSYTTDDIGEHFSGGIDWRSYRGDAVLDGVAPRSGMFLINHDKRRCYGEILSVKDTGAVIWRGPWKDVETAAQTLHQPGYGYAGSPPAGYALMTKDGWA